MSEVTRISSGLVCEGRYLRKSWESLRKLGISGRKGCNRMWIKWLRWLVGCEGPATIGLNFRSCGSGEEIRILF